MRVGQPQQGGNSSQAVSQLRQLLTNYKRAGSDYQPSGGFTLLTVQQEITGRSEAVVTNQLLVLVVTNYEGGQIYEG